MPLNTRLDRKSLGVALSTRSNNSLQQDSGNVPTGSLIKGPVSGIQLCIPSSNTVLHMLQAQFFQPHCMLTARYLCLYCARLCLLYKGIGVAQLDSILIFVQVASHLFVARHSTFIFPFAISVMRSLSLLIAAAATAHASYILPEPIATRDIPPLPTLFKREAFSEPCEEVAASWSAAKPLQTGSITVPAKVAYDCLQTVPVDKEGDLKQIAELKLFLQFQSDLNYLKDGIKTHNAEPLDLLAELDVIAQKVENGTITGEYEVQQSIRLLLLKAGDFHLHWRADIQTPLQFVRANGMLLTYSSDGVALPEIFYGLDPGLAKRFDFTPSPIDTISM